MGVDAVNLLLKELIVILELFDALIRHLEFLLRDLKIAMKICNNSSRLTINNHSQALFLAELSNLTINIRPTAAHRYYNFVDIASATKNLSNLFMKKRRNLHAVSNLLLSALTNDVERRLISNVIVIKTNEVSTIEKTRYYIILACDSEASRDLLFMFVFVFAALSVNIYQHRRSESGSLTILIAKSERDINNIKSN